MKDLLQNLPYRSRIVFIIGIFTGFIILAYYIYHDIINQPLRPFLMFGWAVVFAVVLLIVGILDKRKSKES